MDRATAMAALRTRETELKRLGIHRLYLFGSTVRDEAGSESDVDLFFDHPEGSLGLTALASRLTNARVFGWR
jgi:predicted nucleotidyltransferase